jgi:hypothetical protein
MVPEKTKSGNLNRSKIVAQPEEGARGSKDNSECATVRVGNKPPAEAVRQIDRDANKGKTLQCIDIQIGDGGNNPRDRNVPLQQDRDKQKTADMVHE